MSNTTMIKAAGPMSRRQLGHSGIYVSEVGFGAWAIGGKSYGRVDRRACLDALGRAESLGCNFVDTAEVYGNSEEILGEFLRGRRDNWVVATKYSGQPGGMTAMLERQLRRLGTDAVDLYQIHWVPEDDDKLLEELHGLKRAGKTRLVGVSARSARNIDFVLGGSGLDSVMIPFSLLDPFPFVSRVNALASGKVAVIVRSALKEGFLSGKYTRDASFPEAEDQRHEWSRARIAQTVDHAERFRFLERGHPSLAVAAIRYPLSFDAVSTVIVGAKTVTDADANFGVAPCGRLTRDELGQVEAVQRELKLGTPRQRWSHAVRRLLGVARVSANA